MDKPPDDQGQQRPAGVRSAHNKFLAAVKAAAEASHLELVVEMDGPNSGSGWIQRPDGFLNYYTFHFDFGDKFAVFTLGTDSPQTATAEQRRQVDYRDGKAMEGVLVEIRAKITEATKEAFPQVSSLARVREAPRVALAKPRSEKALWRQGSGDKSYTPRYKGPPKRAYWGTIVGAVLLVLIIFTMAPVWSSQGGISVCRGGSCTMIASYYQSVSFHDFGVGALYVPHVNATVLGAETVQPTNRTQSHVVNLFNFGIAW